VVAFVELGLCEANQVSRPQPPPTRKRTLRILQIILITLAIYCVEEVKPAFRDMTNRGMSLLNPLARKEYSEKQVTQVEEHI
jgi:hypothetical protein